MSKQCPLCLSHETGFFYEDRNGLFFRCQRCSLTFMDSQLLLPPEEELDRYGLHNNDPDDPHYRTFLKRLADPMRKELKPGDCGLDFGCGPGPTLSLIFQEYGFSCRNWDPFFYKDNSALDETYHFISVSEVAEHLYSPGETFAELNRLLKPGGLLGIMTSQLTKDVDFKAWHYKNDPTHVCFYNENTFTWIAEKYQYRIVLCTSSVVLFRKSG